jgi:hypothetical protein
MAVIDVPSRAPDREAGAMAWLQYGLAAVALGSGIIGLGLGLRASPDDGIVPQNAVTTLTTFWLVMSFTLVGLILRRRRVGHSVGWLSLLFGVTVGLSSFVWGVAYVAQLPGGNLEVGRAVAWIGTTLAFPAWAFMAVSLVVRFPTGHPESPQDARLLRWAALACLVAAVLAAVRPGPFLVYPSFSSPLQIPAPVGTVLTVAAGLAFLVALIPMLLAARSMIDRYRRASTVERLQLRWFAYAATIGIGGAVVHVTVGMLLAPDNPALRDATYVLLILGISSLPIAILEAITRHRLYEIDKIIGRTFAYGALTAILAGLYTASLRLFNAVFVATTGEGSEAALVLTTLILATSFTPIKARLERLAAKRFPPEVPPAQRDVAALADQAEGLAGEGPVDGSVGAMDARIEAIARRVAAEVLAESRETRQGGDAR